MQRVLILYFQCASFILASSLPVDLTWNFDNNTIYWSGVQPFVFTKKLALTTDKNFWLAMNEFCAGEHGGTHMDAPYHFNKFGSKISEISLDNLIVNGALVDISKDVLKNESSATLKSYHLIDWENENGPLDSKTLLLIKFGWSKYYPNKDQYLGPNYTSGKLSFPGISTDAAQWIVNTKKIVGVGVDIASVDPGESSEFLVHQILTQNGLYIIENVKLTEYIPARNFTLVAMPMNIGEGTGAPVRIAAVPTRFFNY